MLVCLTPQLTAEHAERITAQPHAKGRLRLGQMVKSILKALTLKAPLGKIEPILHAFGGLPHAGALDD